MQASGPHPLRAPRRRPPAASRGSAAASPREAARPCAAPGRRAAPASGRPACRVRARSAARPPLAPSRTRPCGRRAAAAPARRRPAVRRRRRAGRRARTPSPPARDGSPRRRAAARAAAPQASAAGASRHSRRAPRPRRSCARARPARRARRRRRAASRRRAPPPRWRRSRRAARAAAAAPPVATEDAGEVRRGRDPDLRDRAPQRGRRGGCQPATPPAGLTPPATIVTGRLARLVFASGCGRDGTVDLRAGRPAQRANGDAVRLRLTGRERLGRPAELALDELRSRGRLHERQSAGQVVAGADVAQRDLGRVGDLDREGRGLAGLQDAAVDRLGQAEVDLGDDDAGRRLCCFSGCCPLWRR